MGIRFSFVGALLCILLTADRDAFSFCFAEAGAMYGINPKVLMAIARVESNMKPEEIGKNTNGTHDIGLMQINTIWKPVLGEARWQHIDDACYNTQVGSWILAKCITKYGYNWRAIGCYNSQTPEKSEVYARKVFIKLKQLESGKDPGALDNDVKEAIMDSMDVMVQRAQKGDRKPVKLKFVPYVRVSGKAMRYPPDPPAQDKRSAAVPGKRVLD